MQLLHSRTPTERSIVRNVFLLWIAGIGFLAIWSFSLSQAFTLLWSWPSLTAIVRNSLRGTQLSHYQTPDLQKLCQMINVSLFKALFSGVIRYVVIKKIRYTKTIGIRNPFIIYIPLFAIWIFVVMRFNFTYIKNPKRVLHCHSYLYFIHVLTIFIALLFFLHLHDFFWDNFSPIWQASISISLNAGLPNTNFIHFLWL